MTTSALHFDVAIIGAGIAGLACASTLQQAGQRLVVLEKSRGVGGRVATRRLPTTRADHGTCYLSPKGDRFREFLDRLLTTDVIQVWTDTVHQVDRAGHLQESVDRAPRYTAADGMNAIVKALAPGLEIRFSQRAIAVEPASSGWNLTVALSDETTMDLTANALVVAIPAPQALDLLRPLDKADFLHQLASVTFLPCLSVMAGYESDRLADWNHHYPNIKAISFTDHPALGYLGLDSSKRSNPDPPVFVIQSSAEFADRYLDTIDLQPAATELLHAAAQQFLPWLESPDWMQIHRWRYAFAKTPLPQPFLVAPTTAPLICAGDWCGGRKVEDGFLSGLAAAEYLLTESLPKHSKTP
jgi:renalase